jgi:DNA (cytosine-5)-methyltransferase 1
MGRVLCVETVRPAQHLKTARGKRRQGRMTLTVGSLFSGIGGLDLGLERAGMNVIWQSEIDPYACRVLSKHWPEVPNHGDIKTINWGDVVRPDVICGGYPCQPFSQAGKRRGEDDPRHLWPWVRDAISELRPRYAILENVRGHLSMGGLTVIGELASIGYDAEWRIVSAASVGANHRRDRVIIVAYPNSSNTPNGRQRTHLQSQNRSWGNDRSGSGSDIGEVCMGSARGYTDDVANSDNARGRTSTSGIDPNGTQKVEEWHYKPQSRISGCSTNVANASGERCMDGRFTVYPTNGRFPTFAQPAERGWWQTEPDVGRVAHGIPNRVDRLRGLGNAVVPQVAEVIGRLVISHAQHN